MQVPCIKNKNYTRHRLFILFNDLKKIVSKRPLQVGFLKTAHRQWKKKKVKRKDDVEYEKYLHHREQLKYSKN